MKKSIPLFLAALILMSMTGWAADKPLLAIVGKVIYENKLDTPLAAPWKVAKGKWEIADGVWRAAELPEDKHPAVARMPDKLTNFVVEYEFKLDGTKLTTLSINGPKGHMARIMITPGLVTVQKDSSSHGATDKAVVFARLPAQFATGTWHKVRMEMVGDTMVGQVDNLTAWGRDDSFTAERTVGLTVSGQAVEFRNFKISEATLNPEWSAVQTEISARQQQAPGSAAVPAAPHP